MTGSSACLFENLLSASPDFIFFGKQNYRIEIPLHCFITAPTFAQAAARSILQSMPITSPPACFINSNKAVVPVPKCADRTALLNTGYGASSHGGKTYSI